MCPLIRELNARKSIKPFVCVTGQHRSMLDRVLHAFGVTPDHDLSIMKEGQTLSEVTISVLEGVGSLLKQEHPDVVLVHGDTTSAFAAALAAFYCEIPVGHVEAGLRTYNMASPFPEEFYRQAVALITRFHFAPTMLAAENLLREGKNKNFVFVTGNTGIDALALTVRNDYTHPLLSWAEDSRLIVLTAHRRENIGIPLERMLSAIRRIVIRYTDIKVICPVHQNPHVKEIVSRVLGGCERIRLTPPLDVVDFHNFLARCDLIITDSGGIQEEAAALGKPVLVLRDTTERREGVETGVLTLIGTREADIERALVAWIENEKVSIPFVKNPFGDGHASRYIVDILEKHL